MFVAFLEHSKIGDLFSSTKRTQQQSSNKKSLPETHFCCDNVLFFFSKLILPQSRWIYCWRWCWWCDYGQHQRFYIAFVLIIAFLSVLLFNVVAVLGCLEKTRDQSLIWTCLFGNGKWYAFQSSFTLSLSLSLFSAFWLLFLLQEI